VAAALSLAVLKASPKDTAALTVRALALAAGGDYAGGLPLLAAASAAPGYRLLAAIIHQTLARIHDHIASPSQAAEHRRRAASRDPADITTPETSPPLFQTFSPAGAS